MRSTARTRGCAPSWPAAAWAMSWRWRVVGSRWKIEDGFAASKELTVLDQHQVRSWISWHRWTILALLACVFLSVLAASHPGRAHDDQLIPLTRNEIRRLFTGLHQQVPPPGFSCTGHDGDAATSHRPSLPLPATSPCTHMIANCRWSTNRFSRLPVQGGMT